MPAKTPWKRMDAIESPPPLLEDYLEACYFARDYWARRGFQASECNRIISNFKKSPDRKANQWEWKHKIKAIDQFASELAEFLEDGDTVAFIPTSKQRGSANFDDRFDQVSARLSKLAPGVEIVEPLVTATSRKAAHEGGDRTVKSIRASIECVGLDEIPDDGLFLIDDVVTAGTHFLACAKLLEATHPGIEIGGIFWARTIWAE